MKLYRKLFLFPIWVLLLWTIPFTLLYVTLRLMIPSSLDGASATELETWMHHHNSVYLILTACVYGFWRASRFNPIFSHDYYRTFSLTPWEPGKALPGGPARLAFQDGLLISILATVSIFIAPPGWLYIPGAFILVYALVTAFTCFFAGCRGMGYALLTLVSLVGLDLTNIWLHLGIVSALIGLLYGTTQNHLLYRAHRFGLPLWDNSTTGEFIYAINERVNEFTGASSEPKGWPLNRLPKEGKHGLSPMDKFIVPPLASLFGFVFLAILETYEVGTVVKDYGPLYFLFMALLIMFGVLRLVYYMQGYRSPISLLGRLFTGRWIIPGYDVIFAAPITAVSIFIILSVGLEYQFGRTFTVVQDNFFI